MYAAHREPPNVPRPDISPIGYVQGTDKTGWLIYHSNGFEIGDGPYPTQDAAQSALETHAMVTIARATWMK